jgi:hypothetical protein
VGLIFRIEFLIMRGALVKNWFHIIIIIIILEMISVLIFKFVGVSVNLCLNSNTMLFFITLMVAEARLGMGLVISNARSWGGF